MHYKPRNKNVFLTMRRKVLFGKSSNLTLSFGEKEDGYWSQQWTGFMVSTLSSIGYNLIIFIGGLYSHGCGVTVMGHWVFF